MVRLWTALIIAMIAGAMSCAPGPPVLGPAFAATTRADRSLGAESRRRVDVGGYKLYLDCVGTGSPAVVLGAAYVEAWRSVQPEVGAFTQTCSYDRPGQGMSDSGPLPSSAGEMVRQIRSMLHNAHVPGPYILVGHGFDGTVQRLFASRYPREVAGLVLVDAVHQNLFGQADILIASYIDFTRSRQQLQKAGGLGALPLVVLSHGIPYSYPEDIEKVWPGYQRQLARLSSNSIHILAVHSGISIMLSQPELVQQAILQVLEAARRPEHRLQPCGLSFQAFGGTCL